LTSRSFNTEATARAARRAGERGAALIEFALVLPVLLLVLFGVVDFGKAFNYWNDSTHLANEGARFAAVNNWPTKGSETLQSYIQGQADTAELRGGGTRAVTNPLAVCITTTPTSGAGPGDSVTVAVKVAYSPLGFISNRLGLTGPLNVNSTSTMRLETTAPNYAADNPSGC
jgi:Flp pilus assembly protein TadG